MMEKAVTLPDGSTVPSIGQGTWMLGENPTLAQQEETALRTEIDCGMTL